MFFVPTSHHGADLARNVERFFDGNLARFLAGAGAPESARIPALDVSESPSAYTVQLDMPGVTKEEVKVAIDGRHVRIQTQARPSDKPVDEKADGPRVVYRERARSSFARN